MSVPLGSRETRERWLNFLYEDKFLPNESCNKVERMARISSNDLVQIELQVYPCSHHHPTYIMSLSVFTFIHILISLASILSGLVVLGGWLADRHFKKLTFWFLMTTLATSITGFFFPFKGFTPAYAVGGLSVVLLVTAIFALYLRKLEGPWRKTYIITALISLHLNFFVLIAQLFQKTPALKELAPTQSEPPFAIAQGLLLALIVGLGFAAVRGFRTAGPKAVAPL